MDNKELLNTISEISRKAKSFSIKGKFASAKEEYMRGLSLLKEPVHSSEYASMLFSGIGELYYLQHKWDEALVYFKESIQSEGGLGDPYLHFRLGQIRYEKGEMDKAQDELMRAYMGSGDIIFTDEDPKYYDLIKKHIEKG